MKGNETGSWYEVRQGQYFCKNCNEPLIGQTVTEAFVLDAPSEAAAYHCPKCHPNVVFFTAVQIGLGTAVVKLKTKR